MILGIDEVGRGPWAGPLVVGAVVLGSVKIDGLADSKQLSKKKRERLNEEILASNASVGLGWVNAAEIDEVGLAEALRLATHRAVRQIKVPYHEIIIDGTVNFLSETGKGQYVTLLKKADQLIQAVSAASIVAKVARDKYMAELDDKYPGYNFASHVGYGTAAHRAAIEELGVCSEHRLSVKPVGGIVSSRSSQISNHDVAPGSLLERRAPIRSASHLRHEARLRRHSDSQRSSELGRSNSSPSRSLTSKQIGDAAEGKVCEFLEADGYEILARNWKTRLCEIDIVAAKDDRLYFVEVKYRKSGDRGGGLDAITKKKLDKMKLASEVYIKHSGLTDVDRRLAVASVAGDDYQIQDFMVLE